MKARFVNEENFERTKDPLDSMELGNQKIRGIKKALRFVTPYVESMKADELNFKEFRWEVDKLKDTMGFIVINHLNEKYSIGLKPFKMDFHTHGHHMEGVIATAELPTFEIRLRKNGVGNAFWLEIHGNTGGFHEETTQSNMLKTLDKKAGKILRKYEVI